MKEKCKLCNYETNDRITIQMSKKELINHVRNFHNMTYEKYIIETEYNNIHPICFCGCGNFTGFHKGKFLKYYKDHKNNMIGYKTPHRIKNENDKILDIVRRLKTVNLTIEDIKNYYNDWSQFKINLMELEKKICIDHRTIKSYWKDLGLISSEEDFRRTSKKHQRLWVDKNGTWGGKRIISDDILFDVYIFLSKNRGKYTLEEVKNKFEIEETKLVVYKRLLEKYEKKEIDDLLKFGLSSNEEIEFFNILRFYFGKNIVKQFKLETRFFDMKLGDNILIEFDGTYWHSLPTRQETDRLKNKLAKKYGYTLIRIKDSESKNIQVLNKINEIYENQVKRN
jgi:very-short-patch-repair endonuclease